MASQEPRRPFKKPAISDQQKRRELSLLRQSQNRRDAQHHARCLASSVLSLQSRTPETTSIFPQEAFPDIELLSGSPYERERNSGDIDVHQASKLKGSEGRQWFARQLMLPEWMIDVPVSLEDEWYVFARPAGKRCFVVSSNGRTVSRLRNGSILHYFSSALPNGAITSDHSSSGQTYCILDCIFHELDQTYYVIDMVCWRGYSLHDCNAEFRFFWLNSKLAETGACGPPSLHHKYKFCPVTIYNCDQSGLLTAYMGGGVSYVKDGLLFYNKHAHYQTGNTPLALVWKDESCSQYVIDTDNMGQVPSHQQIVLELQADGKLGTSDDPPVLFGCLDGDFIQKWGVGSGALLRFSLKNDGLRCVDGKVVKADIEYVGKSSRGRAFADTYSKVLFQHRARHSPLSMDELVASLCSSAHAKKACDVNMMTDI